MASHARQTKTYKAFKKLTGKKRVQFLEALRTGISIAGAARAVGVSHTQVYDVRRREPVFAVQMDEAMEAGSDRMEDQLLTIGVRDRNVTALIFLLKGRRPDKFRDRQQTDITNSDGTLAGLFAEAMMHNAEYSERAHDRQSH